MDSLLANHLLANQLPVNHNVHRFRDIGIIEKALGEVNTSNESNESR